MTKTDITPEERTELALLLERATAERLALDGTLREIEALVGRDFDNLDEWVGNGIDVDALLGECGDDEEEEDEDDDEVQAK